MNIDDIHKDVATCRGRHATEFDKGRWANNDGLWPVIDRHGRLTGEVYDSDSDWHLDARVVNVSAVDGITADGNEWAIMPKEWDAYRTDREVTMEVVRDSIETEPIQRAAEDLLIGILDGIGTLVASIDELLDLRSADRNITVRSHMAAEVRRLVHDEVTAASEGRLCEAHAYNVQVWIMGEIEYTPAAMPRLHRTILGWSPAARQPHWIKEGF